MTTPSPRSLAVFYEHPDWFRPLFAELDRRGLPYEKVHAGAHRFDPSEEPPWPVVFNRMSPSAYNRGVGHAIFYTTAWLAHLEERGVRVINGRRAWLVETSKAHQLALLRRLGLPFPASRVVNHATEAPGAARGLRFPVVVKPNIGGSGAGVRRFDTPEALADAAYGGGLELGLDHTALVQELVPQQERRIVRVEVLNGRYLYAIRVYTTGETFDLCPADVCRSVDGRELTRSACAVDAPKSGLRVEGYEPPPRIVEEVERITDAAGIEIGGVEYMIDERDGRLVYYDVNALSNFVADAPRVVGFDPFVRLADWLEAEVERALAAGKEAA